jgi:hypothetical protein
MGCQSLASDLLPARPGLGRVLGQSLVELAGRAPHEGDSPNPAPFRHGRDRRLQEKDATLKQRLGLSSDYPREPVSHEAY